MGKFSGVFRGKKQPSGTSGESANLVLPSRGRALPGPAEGTTSGSSPSPVTSFPDGIKVWHDRPDAIIDICFVHGLTGNRDTTWTARGATSKPWPPEFLPLHLQKARLLTFGYDAYLVRKGVVSSNRLIDHATGLLNDLTNERAAPDEARRPLIFVCHSLGGLVCKEAILLSRDNPEDHLRDIFECVVGIAFMGTPHKGSWMADWAKIPLSALGLVKSSNSPLLAILETNDQLLESIQSRFWSMIRGLRESGRRLEVTCFFEELPLPLAGKIVSKESATLEGYPSLSIHANHSDMVKFGSMEDNGFKRLLGALRRWEGQAMPKANKEPVQRHYVVSVELVESFVQRDELWKDLHSKLQIRHETASIPFAVAIHGLGGAGKSQLALKYMETHKHRFNPVLWIDATDEESARFSYHRCAAELGLLKDQPQAPSSRLLAHEPSVQAVLKWLRDRTEEHDEWLVVVDNADDFKWGLGAAIPKGQRGSLIVTSQDEQSRTLIPRGCESLHVDMMSPRQAMTLLFQHLPLSQETASATILETGEKILKELGYLALAVDVAGAYIGNANDPAQALTQYLADFKRHRTELLQVDRFYGLLPTQRTVWTVWDKTLQKLTNEYEYLHPTLFLSFLAHFRGPIIQEEVFRLAAKGLKRLPVGLIDRLPAELRQYMTVSDGEWDQFQYRQIRDIFARYSLLRRVVGGWPGITMHGLVQWRALQTDQSWDLPQSYQTFMAAACSETINEEHRPEFRRQLVAHLPENREILSQVASMELYADLIAHKISSVYYNEGRLDMAEELELAVLGARKQNLGENHPDTLASMGELAMTYWSQGRWDAAEKLEVEVLEVRKRTLGLDHRNTIESMANLAATYRRQGRWGLAEKLYIEVLAAHKRELGLDHPDTLHSMADLAATYRQQGRWDLAEELEVEVLKVRKRKLGLDHPDTLGAMANLSDTYHRQDRLDLAEELAVEAWEARKRKLGADHPDTLQSMAILASTFYHQGRLELAEELGVEAWEAYKQKLGADHPHTLTTMATLSIIWNAQGRTDDALELMEQCLEKRIRVLGEDHPYTKTLIPWLCAWRDQAPVPP